LINFIECPRFVEDTKSPFREDLLMWLAANCDLIFVFLNPIGGTFCHGTMRVIEQLHLKFQSKIHYYLAKADELNNDQNYQKTLIEIENKLSVKLKNQLQLQSFYIPSISALYHTQIRIPNAIEDMCDEIEKALTLSVQNALNALQSDCSQVATLLDDKIIGEEEEIKSANKSASLKYGLLFGLAAVFWPITLSILLFDFIKDTFQLNSS